MNSIGPGQTIFDRTDKYWKSPIYKFMSSNRLDWLIKEIYRIDNILRISVRWIDKKYTIYNAVLNIDIPLHC